MDIQLSQIYPIAHPEEFKLHLACWNQFDQPLDVFVRDRTEWEGWNRYRGSRDDFNRPYIFSLIDFYPEKDRWLFGGAFRVLSRRAVTKESGYDIELLEDSRPFIGRLKLSLKRPYRTTRVFFENHYENLTVSEILSSAYTGESFCGYDQINIGFAMLESIFAIQRPDWKAALENAKGVYLITDISNGKRYIGSAYGAAGIWSRWASYIDTGHGYTDELTQLIKICGKPYARKNFRFALLEHRTPKTDDEIIIQREKYWKDVLLTRDYGYNRN